MSRPSRVSTYKPAVQTHAGLYSGFTPSVAALDQPSPKTFSEAQKAASNVLWGAPPSGLGVHKARDQYMRQHYNSLGKNVAWDMFSGSSTTSSEPSYYSGSYNTSYNSLEEKVAWDTLSGSSTTRSEPSYYSGSYNTSYNSLEEKAVWDILSGSSTTRSKPSYYSGSYNTSYNTSYAHPSLYSSTGSSKRFHTCGNLGGEQHIRTGGAVGGGTIAQTGGSLGGGSVSKTGGSLGEALGLTT